MNGMYSQEVSLALRVHSKSSVALQLLTALRILAYSSDPLLGNVIFLQRWTHGWMRLVVESGLVLIRHVEGTCCFRRMPRSDMTYRGMMMNLKIEYRTGS